MNRRVMLIALLARLAWAQYPQPHTGWKLVPGGEDLNASSYWGFVYQYNDGIFDLTAPAIRSSSVSGGVLTAVSDDGYSGGYSPLGPWLYTSGDFGIMATIQTGPGLDGMISLTGSLAKGTEFWQGRTAIFAGVINTGDYVFSYWDGTSNGPTLYRTLKAGSGVPATGQVTVEVLRQAGQFLIYFNGTQYGPFADPGLFQTKYVMPGYQLSPRQQLKASQFALEIPLNDHSAQLIEPVGAVPFTHVGDSLGSLAAVTGRDFSIVGEPGTLTVGENTSGTFTRNAPDATLQPRVVGEFGAFTTISANYWKTEPAQGRFVFDEVDAMIATAKGTGRPLLNCGDLIDGDRIPYWVLHGNFTKAQLIQVMQTHIQTVMAHLKGQCGGWTVVNEAFANDGSVRTDLLWQQVIGSSYIDLAFQAARQMDPTAKLYLKDYSAENDNVKAAGIYNYVAGMKQKGIPVDGVAMQAHWVVGVPGDCCTPNHDSIVANMTKLAGLGLKVRISELDIRMKLPATAANFATQADFASITVQACLDSPNCEGITVFGTDDALSWIDYTFPGSGAATLFDASFNPKPAYNSVMNTLRAAPKAKSTITKVNTASGGNDIAQNTFIEVKGINLVPASTPAAGVIWNDAPDFASGKMPTNLKGVSVTVNGKPAFVYFYCSVVTSPVCTSDQINVLTPLDNTTGPVQVVVTSGNTVSTAFTANLQTVAPTFLLFNALGPVVATHADYSLLGSANLYPGATTPAKPGEAVVLYGIGFGLPMNAVVNGSSSQAGALPSAPTCTVGGTPTNAIATLISPGLYQLNLSVPSNAPSGDNAINCSYAGVTTPPGDFLTVLQ